MLSLEANRLRRNWRRVAYVLGFILYAQSAALFGPVRAAYADGGSGTQTVGVSFDLTGCAYTTSATSVPCVPGSSVAWSSGQELTWSTICDRGSVGAVCSSFGPRLQLNWTGTLTGLSGTICYVRIVSGTKSFVNISGSWNATGNPTGASPVNVDDGGSGPTAPWAYWYRANTTNHTGTCSAATDPGAPPHDASKGTSTCARTLTGTDAMTGQFSVTRTGLTNATVTTNDWDWGDSTTHGTTAAANHTYGALSTMPVNGWTATITQTVVASGGHLFSDGTTSQTGTCQLRVDFLNPSLATPGSTGSTGTTTGTAGLDACLPSGWNVLNPLALVGSLGCVLKYLFIPSSATVSSLGSLWTTATTHVPFSIVNDVVTYIPNTLDDFQAGINSHSPINGYNYDVSHAVARSSICDHNGIGLCGTGAYPFAGSTFDVHGYAGCTTDCEAGNTYVLATRTVLLFVIVVIFLYACWRGAGEILK